MNPRRPAMKLPERKYALDTNLFIEGLRDAETHARLLEFHVAFAPFEYLHSVVVQELRVGVKDNVGLRKLEKHILSPFIGRGRMITPSFEAWKRSGDVLRELAHERALELSKVTKSFGNDILLATSCRESGVVLVTDNVRDFQRIHQVFSFDFVAPWPQRRA
jgi:predicted nucleic acid-binding protein